MRSRSAQDAALVLLRCRSGHGIEAVRRSWLCLAVAGSVEQGMMWISFLVCCALGLYSTLLPSQQPVLETRLAQRDAGGELYADRFSGTDLSARVAAAFASQAGRAAAPIPSAMVLLAPNQTYTFSAAIQIPNATSAPYIVRPVLDCRGSTLVYTGRGVGPAVLVHGENANNSANGSGSLQNCTIVRNDADGPVVLDMDRNGFQIRNVTLQGGRNSYEVVLTTSDGGPGYREQSLLENVAFVLPAEAGVYVHNGAGGSGGYQYNFGSRLRFQFGGAGRDGSRSQFHFGAGVNAFNNSYTSTLNAEGGGTAYMVRADPGASVLSGFLEYNGESTDGSVQLRVGGGGVIDIACRALARAQTTFDSNAFCHADRQVAGPYTGSVQIAGESFYKGGARAAATIDTGDAWMRFEPLTEGFEHDHGTEQIKACSTSEREPFAWTSKECINQLFHVGNGGFGFGPGFHDSTRGSSDAVPHTVSVHGSYGSSVPGTANDEYTQWEQVDGVWTLVHTMRAAVAAGGQTAPEIWRFANGNGSLSDGVTCRARGDGQVDCAVNGRSTSAGVTDTTLKGSGCAVAVIDANGTLKRGNGTACVP